MIKQRIALYIQKESIIIPNEKVLVALSGGADSVALLRILLSLNYDCEAAHCNFHLRNEESDRDEDFVKQLCKKLHVPLHITHFNTKEYATRKKISIEMAARELRYNWFAEIKEKCKASSIAVAHHQDDSVETMLLNLIRGTGINGLLGMRPRHGDIIRPLLCVNREEVIAYLQSINQDYVTDSTNLQDEFTRNKIRLKLLPLMEEINPAVKQSLMHTANHLSQVATLYNRYIDKGKEYVCTNEGIIIERLLSEASPQALLFEILHPYGFNPAQLEDIFHALTKQPGKQFISTKGVRVIKDRELLLIDPGVASSKESPCTLHIEEKEYAADFVIPRTKNIACFDADKVKQPFTTRKWQHGDSFIPFGMKGRKLVSDYLTDRKFSLFQKENQWVLCSGQDIIWLIGERPDNRFRVDEHTRKVLLISLREQ